LKRGHLLGVGSGIPHADIGHCIVLKIDSDVISLITLQCADDF
jgi:hypothetical protein